MNEQQALEPCPFCEWTPVARSRNAKGVASGKHYFVRCPMCHTEGPRSTNSEASAINLWNNRTESSGRSELLEALKEAQRAINSMKVEAENGAVIGDEQGMLDACEQISKEGLEADMAIRALIQKHTKEQK
jgi:hypothetical protein